MPPASTVAPLATASSTWAVTVSSWSWLISEPMSAPHSMPGRSAIASRALDELGPEPVVDLVGDEHPLHRDAQLAGVGEARPDRALGGPVEVGVAQDQDRVLAAELERAADQPVGALLRDQLAGGGGAGEADVVGALDDRRTELAAGPGDDVPEALREAGLLEQLGAEQRARASSGRRAW